MWTVFGFWWMFPLVFVVLMVLCMFLCMGRCRGGMGCCCGGQRRH